MPDIFYQVLYVEYYGGKKKDKWIIYEGYYQKEAESLYSERKHEINNRIYGKIGNGVKMISIIYKEVSDDRDIVLRSDSWKVEDGKVIYK